MNNLVRVGALLVCVLLTGCGGTGGSRTYTPPPAGTSSAAERDIIRAGDRITVRLTGVPDNGYFVELPIPASGEIKLNLLNNSIQAVGKTPDELAAEIAQDYKAQKLYSNPVVTVLPEERFVIMGGDVRSPSNVVWHPGLTLMSAIYSSGGFTEFANRHQVRILRGNDKFYVDCVKAIQNPGSDPLVYPGDQIYVLRNPF